jgi:translation initiation factor 1 (eIF-1/SUI1)
MLDATRSKLLLIKYCEFGAQFQKCKTWLEDYSKELYEKLYGGSAPESVDPKPIKQKQKQKTTNVEQKITITLIERTKRKSITQIRGLESFGK